MSGVGGAAGSNNKDFIKELAKNAGTGPTETEKRVGKAIVEEGREVAGKVSEFVKTPEGKAIATGVLFKALMPFSLVGDAIIFGGAACAAKNHFVKEGDKDALKEVGKKVMEAVTSPEGRIIEGALLTPINPLLGTVLMTTGVVDKAQGTIDSAKHAAKAAAKAGVEGVVSGVGKAATEAVKNAVEEAVQKAKPQN